MPVSQVPSYLLLLNPCLEPASAELVRERTEPPCAFEHWAVEIEGRAALQGPSRCREQQRPAVAGGVPAEQVSTTSESEVEDEDKSSQSGDRRVHGETGHSNPCKVSRHSSATVLNAQVAEHDQPRGSPQESWGRRPWLLPSPLHENKLQGVE